MKVFKAALKLFFRHPIYLLIYVVWLSVMGVFMGLAVSDTTSSDYLERPAATVIDRDGGVLAQQIVRLVADKADWVDVADSERSIQDALMQQQVSYIAVVPEGFTDDFMRYARGEGSAPALQTTAGVQGYASTMMDNLVDEYLRLVRTYARADADATPESAASSAAQAMKTTAEVRIVEAPELATAPTNYLVYMQFSCYTTLLSIAICTAVIMSRFNRFELRRRNLASPMKPLAQSLQVAAACFVVMLVCWGIASALGVVVFHAGLEGVGAAPVVMAIADLFVYALFALALGFLIGQLTESEMVMNAVPNVVGLVCSFLGGTWVSLDLVGEPVLTLAKFTPTYYYKEALQAAFDPSMTHLHGANGSLSILANMGMVALFAVALFAVALAISRTKRT